MLTPGFLTDGVGLLLLLPPSRIALRTALIRRFRSRVTVLGAPGHRRRIVDLGDDDVR